MTPEKAIELVREHGSVRAAARNTGRERSTVRHYYNKAVAAGLAEPPQQASRRFTPGEAEALIAEHGSARAAARAVGVHHTTILDARTAEPRHGREHRPDPRVVWKRGTPRRFLLTCAQNNTDVHDAFVANLLAYADHLGAELLVSRFTYDVTTYRERSVKAGTSKEQEDIWWHGTAEQFASDEPLELAPGLIWCGEMNILPTAVRPLSGLETYTGVASGIIPHVKIALESTPRMPSDPPRYVMTTGAITMQNYIQKKAGMKAEFHHCYGAVLIEVDAEGTWWARHLNAAADGSFHDLDCRVAGGAIEVGHGLAGVVLGDLHAHVCDPSAFRATCALLRDLRPQEVVVHDALDFYARNHHRRNDPHAMFLRHVEGAESVVDELQRMTRLLDELGSHLRGGALRLVASNHDEALDRWIRETDYRRDPVNALFFLRLQTAMYEHVHEQKGVPPALPLALNALGKDYWPPSSVRVRVLGRDDAYKIAGIEVSQHGDIGPNGAKGSPRGFERAASKLIVGHGHSPYIREGVYAVGTLSRLNLEYTRGLTAWDHAHCVIYPNGKRAIVTLKGEKYCA